MEAMVLALLKKDVVMDMALGSAETADSFWVRGTCAAELESVPRGKEETGPAEGLLVLNNGHWIFSAIVCVGELLVYIPTAYCTAFRDTYQIVY